MADPTFAPAGVDPALAPAGDNPWLHVRTTESASYDQEATLDYLKRILPVWVPGSSKWRILQCDAFRGHDGDVIEALCWSRGFVVVRVGGGCTGTVQVNDTHLHATLDQRFLRAEAEFMAKEELVRGGLGVVSATQSDCLCRLAAVWASRDLHVAASKGFVQNGYQVPLSGAGAFAPAEGCGLRGDAQRFWLELQMPLHLARAMADLEDEHHRAGATAWTRDRVRGLIAAFPPAGQLDSLEPGQDDEGEPPVEVAGFRAEMGPVHGGNGSGLGWVRPLFCFFCILC